MTFAVFSPALRNEFVGWDDFDLLVNNTRYRGLGWEQLHWMFTTFHQGHYLPLSWMTLGLDYLIWGMNPFGYHLTNLLIHAANASLFYLLAVRFFSLAFSGLSPLKETSLRVTAAFSALFFAVHPLRVESVVWATERRDVLSGLFYVLTLLAYVSYLRSRKFGGRWYWAAVALFLCAVLSKSITVTLPGILLILDIYPFKRLGGSSGWWSKACRAVYLEKIPFFLISAAASVMAFLAIAPVEAMATLETLGIVDRLTVSVYGLCFYFWKTLAPFNLSAIYEMPRLAKLSSVSFMFSYVFVIVAVALGLALWRRIPAVLAVEAAYLITLFPVLGIFQNGRQLVADRYSYLSCLGWALLAGGVLFRCWQQSGDQRHDSAKVFIFAPAAAATVIVVFALLTAQQVTVWHDSISLFKHATAITDKSVFRSATAHHLEARFLADRGDFNEAIEHLRTSIEIEPNDFTAYSDLAITLFKVGRTDEAIETFRHAITLNPRLSVLRFHLGNALALQGRFAEAVQHLRDALRIDPNYPQAYNSLGKIMAAQGQLDGAIDSFRQAVKIQPDFIEARRNLAMALNETGKKEEATQELQEAARIANLRSRSEIR